MRAGRSYLVAHPHGAQRFWLVRQRLHDKLRDLLAALRDLAINDSAVLDLLAADIVAVNPFGAAPVVAPA